jgi:hypothetical protein
MVLALALAALACNTLVPGGPATFVPTEATVDVGETPEAPCCSPPSPTPPAAPSETPASGATETPLAAPTETPAATGTTFIAYVVDGQLLVTDVTGGVLGGTTQYTQAGVDDGVTDLVWSPSGEFIAYTGLIGTEQHVFVVYAVGAGTPLDMGAGATPAWSPDSTQLAFQNAGQIWITPVEAPEPRQLTAQDNWAWGRPAFAPDGLSLVVSGESFNDMGASGNTTFFLYSLPLDGSGTLTPLPGMAQEVEGRLPYDLQFSPDGSHLAFSTSWHLSACASSGSYYLLNNDGSSLLPLKSVTLDALANEVEEDYYTPWSYAWLPDSSGLLASGLVRDCTDFAGTVLGAQMSTMTLAGGETLVASGDFAPVSINNEGTLIGANLNDGSGTGRVQVYGPLGDLLLEVGAGDGARIQP